ncbi:GTPase [Prosthecochloris sp. GSB1]|uniref:GTPase n=1 Tax=Prosthecochloris sp. GSB1 TaxID=281093 RepID=UPI000B8CF47D|nr:GTPase [Prosthecochloris sp. GSB1]ASQ91661.1 GTPase [Prosthecochloris sp. GSB1]
MTSLVFVYNSDSGPVSGLLDIGHKLLSPDTYQCSLCNLTHDAFAEKAKWKEFRQNVGMPMEFLHRDEFEKKFGRKAVYPVIFQKNDDLEVLMPKEDIDGLKTLDELIEAVRKAL